MSYILDALRRADSERERDRGTPPSLHDPSPAYGAAGVFDDADDAQTAPWPWAVLGGVAALVLVLGAGAWWLKTGSPTARLDGAAASVVGAARLIEPMMPVAEPVVKPAGPGVSDGATVKARPGGSSAGPSAAGAATASGAGPGGGSAPVLVPLPALLPDPPKPPVRDKPAVARPPIRPQLPGAAESAAGKAAKPPAAVGARALRDLPQAQRRQLPPLVVSGSMYSPTPASRMIVLDGQVLREGQSVRPGLVVESIGQRTATLSHQGERFQISF